MQQLLPSAPTVFNRCPDAILLLLALLLLHHADHVSLLVEDGPSRVIRASQLRPGGLCSRLLQIMMRAVHRYAAILLTPRLRGLADLPKLRKELSDAIAASDRPLAAGIIHLLVL